MSNEATLSNRSLTGISSMATRQLLVELVEAWHLVSPVKVLMEAVGGVDAAKRVQAGEAFDVVVLAADAIDKLMAAGVVDAGSRVDLVNSGVSVAVPQGAPLPRIDSAQAVREAVLAASSVGYSTGPSGVALVKLFEQWGIAQALEGRLVQAPAGVPVGAMVARGDVALGFQQLSELIHLKGITIVGPLPDDMQIITTFSAGICSKSTQKAAARDLIAFMASAGAVEAKLRQGMEPV